MWYQLNDIQQRIKKRNAQKICSRCGLLHDKKQLECPHCHHIEDGRLKILISKRAHQRIRLGKGMFLLH